MQSAHRRGKKRKPEADLEAERSLYASFATAANSVSQLYSLALGQQARYRDEGARQSLVSCVALELVILVLPYSCSTCRMSCP